MSLLEGMSVDRVSNGACDDKIVQVGTHLNQGVNVCWIVSS